MTFFWSDSTTVIQRIRNSHKRQQIFIANRVSEIHETTSIRQWRHCPGDINSADDATRGIPDLTETCRWFTGPSFLMKTPENWPADIPQTSSEPAVFDKPFDAVSCRAQLTQTIDFPINFTKFSSWFRFVRITAFVDRAVRIFRNSVRNSQYRTSLLPYLTATEFTNAKTKLLQFFQTQSFLPEISAVKSEQPLPCSSRIKTLTPFSCPNGFLRAHGGLEKCQLDHDTKRPIILNDKHPISQLLILATHRQEQHSGLQHTRHVLQQTFWITSARSANRRVITHCYDCRRQHAYGTQLQMSVLPGFRFTTRAVHLEMCPDVSTAATINALRRLFHHTHLTSVEYGSASYVPAKMLFIQSLDLRR